MKEVRKGLYSDGERREGEGEEEEEEEEAGGALRRNRGLKGEGKTRETIFFSRAEYEYTILRYKPVLVNNFETN